MSIKKEIELEECIRLVEKEVEVLGEDLERIKLDTKEAIDALRLEIESIKLVLERSIDGFKEKLEEMREVATREIDPEGLKKGV